MLFYFLAAFVGVPTRKFSQAAKCGKHTDILCFAELPRTSCCMYSKTSQNLGINGYYAIRFEIVKKITFGYLDH